MWNLKVAWLQAIGANSPILGCSIGVSARSNDKMTARQLWFLQTGRCPAVRAENTPRVSVGHARSEMEDG